MTYPLTILKSTFNATYNSSLFSFSFKGAKNFNRMNYYWYTENI